MAAQVHTLERSTAKIELANSQSPARHSRLALSFAVMGALSFWLPDVVIHIHAGPKLDARHVWTITLLAPAIFILTYVASRRLASKCNYRRVGPAMLLGVWLSGGLFMTIAAMASGSEFIGGSGIWRGIVIIISVIPIVTYVLSAYDGSVFALLAGTVGGLLIWGIRTGWMLWTGGAGNATSGEKRGSHDHSKAA